VIVSFDSMATSTAPSGNPSMFRYTKSPVSIGKFMPCTAWVSGVRIKVELVVPTSKPSISICAFSRIVS